MFGDHRHQRQDHHGYLLQAALRAAGQRDRSDRHHRLHRSTPTAGGRRTTVTTPEATELQALLAVMAEQRRRRGRDGGVLPRARPGPGRRASSSTSPPSPTSAPTTSTSTATSRPTSRPRRRCSPPARTAGGDQRRRSPRPRAGRRRRAGGAVGGPRSVWTRPADYRRWSPTCGRGPDRGHGAGPPHGTLEFTLGLPGEFNVRNALTALAMADLAGGRPRRRGDRARRGGGAGSDAAGRLGAGAPAVFVDFAHTPQAVTAVLASARPAHRRIVGAGLWWRPRPGEAGADGCGGGAGAEVVVVTDDNPRTEDPAAIRAEVLAGRRAAGAERAAGRSTVIDGGDRRDAIAAALRVAGPDDVVAVLGKGHETRAGDRRRGAAVRRRRRRTRAVEWRAAREPREIAR